MQDKETELGAAATWVYAQSCLLTRDGIENDIMHLRPTPLPASTNITPPGSELLAYRHLLVYQNSFHTCDAPL
jgi:hypothetical protein